MHGLYVSTNIMAAVPICMPVTNYPFFQPIRLFTNPYDANELWLTSFGNGLHVGWLSEPQPIIESLTLNNGVASFAGSSSDGQHLRFQGSTNLLDWIDLATNVVMNENFINADLQAGQFNRRFYRATLVSPVIGQP